MILFGIILVWTALYSFLFYFTHLSLWFYFLWVPLSLILALLTLVLVIWILFIYMKRTDPKGKFRHHLLHQATELILWCLRIKVTAEGKENIPSEPFVCYANHKSDIDPVALYYQLHRICTAIGKKSLFHYRSSNSVSRSSEPFRSIGITIGKPPKRLLRPFGKSKTACR